MEIKFIPQEIEYRAFQFALFKRKIIFLESTIIIGSNKLQLSDITAVRYGRTNRLAGNRIAKSEYRIDLRTSSNKKVKIHFSYVASQGSPERLEKVYFDLINGLLPVTNNLLNNNIKRIDSGETLDFDKIKMDKQMIEIKHGTFNKTIKVPWTQFNLQYKNGSLYFYQNSQEITFFDYSFFWNLKIVEELCKVMKAYHERQILSTV